MPPQACSTLSVGLGAMTVSVKSEYADPKTRFADTRCIVCRNPDEVVGARHELQAKRDISGRGRNGHCVGIEPCINNGKFSPE